MKLLFVVLLLCYRIVNVLSFSPVPSPPFFGNLAAYF